MNKVVKWTVIGILVAAVIASLWTIIMWTVPLEEYRVLDQSGTELGKVSAPISGPDGCEIAKDAAKVANIQDFECDGIQTGDPWEVTHTTGPGTAVGFMVDMNQKTAQLFYSP